MKVLDVVALLVDLPEKELVRGQIGTLVEELEPGVFEVEFSDRNGVPIAFAALSAAQVMPLVKAPVQRSAS